MALRVGAFWLCLRNTPFTFWFSCHLGRYPPVISILSLNLSVCWVLSWEITLLLDLIFHVLGSEREVEGMGIKGLLVCGTLEAWRVEISSDNVHNRELFSFLISLSWEWGNVVMGRREKNWAGVVGINGFTNFKYENILWGKEVCDPLGLSSQQHYSGEGVTPVFSLERVFWRCWASYMYLSLALETTCIGILAFLLAKCVTCLNS